MSEKKRSRPGGYITRLSRRLLAQYAISLVVIPGVVALLGLAAAALLRAFDHWRESELLFSLFYWCRDWLPGIFVATTLLGWLIATLYLVRRPLRYLDELVDAAERLTRPAEGEPIVLSPALQEAQSHLNAARESAARDARAAKEAEQRKNDLVIYLAHDLKTPLTSVIGYLTLLRDEPEISTELRCRYTGIALEKAERLEALIDEFFDITRFSLTALTLEPERISLSRMLEQLADEFRPILAEKGLRWQAEIPPEVEILADPNKLERVFDNLIRNAVNYSYPDTAISLTLDAHGGQAEITIQNHGRTIPPDKLARIFEQFFRLDASRSSATGGAGLGLAIARQLVELHHGTISAASESESVTFTVTLPLGLS